MISRQMFRCFLLILFLAVPRMASAATVEARTKQLYGEILQVLKQESVPRKREKGLQLFNDYFDFDTFAKLTLHDHWKSLSPIQKRRFLSLFRRRFVARVLHRLTRPTKKKFVFKVRGVHPIKKKYREVKCRVHYNNKSVGLSLIWLYHRSEKKWYLVDLTISKSNLVANYQGQFNKIIRDHGFEDLLLRIETKKIDHP